LVQGRNPAYGHTLTTGYKFKPGEEYTITLEVTLSSPNKKDGSFKATINGKTVATLNNILWPRKPNEAL